MKSLFVAILFFGFNGWAQSLDDNVNQRAFSPPTSQTSISSTELNQLSADIKQCGNHRKQAELCCNDPMKCAGGMSPEAQQQLMQLVGMGAMGAMAMMNSGESGFSKEGIAGLCSMLGALGGAGAGVNSGSAKVCEETRGTCTTDCAKRAEKWISKRDACVESNCTNVNVITEMVGKLEASISTCAGLSANVEAMQSQTKQTGGAGEMGQFCSQIASMMPEKEQAQLAAVEQVVVDCNDPAQALNPLCIDCKADPTNVACGKPTQSNGGLAGFSEGSGVGVSDFNTGDGMDGLNQDPQFGAFQPQANRSGTVQGGGGGGIMGGGNDGGGFGDEKPQQGGGGYETDILGGERGGGYSASVGAMGVESGSGFSGYGSGYSADEDLPYEGMDLKKFLPGGDMDPSRRLAGALVNSGQINDKNANIFERISQRMKAVCGTNRLKDCGKK